MLFPLFPSPLAASVSSVFLLVVLFLSSYQSTRNSNLKEEWILLRSTAGRTSRSLSTSFVVSVSNSDSDSRELFSMTTRQCSLSTDVLKFRYNASKGLYEPMFNISYGLTSSNGTTTTYNISSVVSDNTNRSSTSNNQPRYANTTVQERAAPRINPGFQQDDGAIEQMRACWCTVAYFDRPMEFCPAQFDTCLVQGYMGPVSCYTTSGADSFVRSFWPVALFWIVALVYALWCSDSGQSARQYARRRFCLYCCTHHRTQEEALNEDLQRLIDNSPDRAGFLYRHAVRRARHLHQQQLHLQQQLQLQQQQNRPHRWWSCWGSGNRVSSRNAARQAEDDIFMRTYQNEFCLKTRVFIDPNAAANDTQPAAASPNLASGSLPRSSSRRASSSNNNNNNNADANRRTGFSSWLPFSCRHAADAVTGVAGREGVAERATLDEMDDQMEQGVRCAICLVRLEQGDVIGDIPCNHVFHKDCLKDWLKRKNRCPLCQRPDLAWRRPDAHSTAITTTTASSRSSRNLQPHHQHQHRSSGPHQQQHRSPSGLQQPQLQ